MIEGTEAASIDFEDEEKSFRFMTDAASADISGGGAKNNLTATPPITLGQSFYQG